MSRLLAKLLSVRLWATLSVIWTLCWAVIKCFDILATSVYSQDLMLEVDEQRLSLVKEIIMYILGSFTSVVSAIVTLYFTRTDRWVAENREGEEEKEK